MWICLNRAFLSIVQPTPFELAAFPDTLKVRARRPGDIESVFPGVKVIEDGSRDYLFRAFIPRGDVAVAMVNEVNTIDYGNFKSSTKDYRLHNAYSKMWDVHARLQPTPPYRGNDKPHMPLFKMGDHQHKGATGKGHTAY